MAQDNHAKTDGTKNKGKMTVQKAGQLGGEKTSETHDEKFYHDIGSEGGKASSGSFAEGGGREKDKDPRRDTA